MVRNFRKPLIVVGPKLLLRLPVSDQKRLGFLCFHGRKSECDYFHVFWKLPLCRGVKAHPTWHGKGAKCSNWSAMLNANDERLLDFPVRNIELMVKLGVGWFDLFIQSSIHPSLTPYLPPSLPSSHPPSLRPSIRPSFRPFVRSLVLSFVHSFIRF